MKSFLVLLCLTPKILADLLKNEENCDCVFLKSPQKYCGASECRRCVKNFDFWDKEIQRMKNGTNYYTNSTNFDGLFNEINQQFVYIKHLLKETENVSLDNEDGFQEIQQRFDVVEKFTNTAQDLLLKLENDALSGGKKIDENYHKLKTYKQKLMKLTSDTKNLKEKSVKGSLNKINVILKKMKILSQAVTENNSKSCTEELKKLQNDLEDLRKINDNVTNIKETIFLTDLPSANLEQLKNLQNRTDAKLNMKEEMIKKIAQDVLSLNIVSIKNKCQNILNITNDTLQNSIKLLNKTDLVNDIKTVLKQKQPNLKDFEDLMKKILAKKISLKPDEIEKLKDTLLKIIESNQNPFIVEEIKRLEKGHENITTKINMLKKYAFMNNINKTLAKLEEIKVSQNSLNEKINETLLTVSNFDISLKKFQQNLHGIQKSLEKFEEKLKILEESLSFFDGIKDVYSTSKLIESDAISSRGEYKNLLNIFDDQYDEFKKRQRDIHLDERRSGNEVRLDVLLLRASRLKKISPNMGHKNLLRDIEILSGRLNDYLIAIEKSAVEHNNC